MQIAFRIKCLIRDYFQISIASDAFLDFPDSPNERYIRLYNGLRRSDPNYQGSLLHLQLVGYGHITADFLECTDGFSIGAPKANRRPDPIFNARIVHDSSCVYAEINGKSVSPPVSYDFRSSLRETVTETVYKTGFRIIWEDDIYCDEVENS